MKKAMAWLFVASIRVLFIVWGILGIKLMNGEYDITAGAYVGLVCVLLMLACIIYRLANNRCPHCGRVIWQLGGAFCPYCGGKLK